MWAGRWEEEGGAARDAVEVRDGVQDLEEHVVPGHVREDGALIQRAVEDFHGVLRL